MTASSGAAAQWASRASYGRLALTALIFVLFALVLASIRDISAVRLSLLNGRDLSSSRHNQTIAECAGLASQRLASMKELNLNGYPTRSLLTCSNL